MMDRFINCLQINLRHCREAFASLAQVILDHNIDLVFIQEPYTSIKPSFNIPNIPTGYKIWHPLSPDRESHCGAAILAKQSLHVQLIPSKSNNFVTTVQVTSDNQTFNLVSAYCKRSSAKVLDTLNVIIHESPTFLKKTQSYAQIQTLIIHYGIALSRTIKDVKLKNLQQLSHSM
jgi:hypothetical protein